MNQLNQKRYVGEFANVDAFFAFLLMLSHIPTQSDAGLGIYSLKQKGRITCKIEINLHMKIIARNGRCGHLSDRGDTEFCDGETIEHVQTTSAKYFEILSPSPAPK